MIKTNVARKIDSRNAKPPDFFVVLFNPEIPQKHEREEKMKKVSKNEKSVRQYKRQKR